MSTNHIMKGLQGWAVWVHCLVLAGLPELGSAQGFPIPQPPVAPGCKLIEGDIQVPANFEFGALATKAVWTSDLWPGGEVPYEFDDNVSEANREHARNAMAIWEGVANVRFRSKNWDDFYYIHIQDSTENSSPVGRQLFSHDVNISSWEREFIIVHELGHTLGFWHEQSRSDRDSYIQVNTGNIQDDQAHNFDKHDEADHYGPYDFDSVMHYAACAFSKDSCTCGNPATRTITVLPPWDTQWQCRIGQLNHLSHFDALTMSFLYPYDDWRFVDGSYDGGETGTFLSPYRTFETATTQIPDGGTLWIQPGTYSAVGNYTKAMVLQAPLGGVVLSY